MEQLKLHSHRLAWATRMARVGLPKHQIAFKLGVSLEDLRRDFAADMRHATNTLNLHIIENLARLALSPNHSAATIFWVKYCCWPKSESKNAHNSNQYNNQEIPEFMVTGPNGDLE
jgi:hypothetical protein